MITAKSKMNEEDLVEVIMSMDIEEVKEHAFSKGYGRTSVIPHIAIEVWDADMGNMTGEYSYNDANNEWEIIWDEVAPIDWEDIEVIARELHEEFMDDIRRSSVGIPEKVEVTIFHHEGEDPTTFKFNTDEEAKAFILGVRTASERVCVIREED